MGLFALIDGSHQSEDGRGGVKGGGRKESVFHFGFGDSGFGGPGQGPALQ